MGQVTMAMVATMGRRASLTGLVVFLLGVLAPGPSEFVDDLITVGLALLAAGVVLYVAGTTIEPAE